MKILLVAVNAKYIHSNPAVYSLKTYAGECSEHIEIAEYTINNLTEHILEGIYRKTPDVLCFSCYIWNIESIRYVATEFHKLSPNVPIWVGGPEVSYYAEKFLAENNWCSGIMVGEGEATFKELTEYYLGKIQSLENIKSLVYRADEQNVVEPYSRYIHTDIREGIRLDDIPFIYDDLNDFSNRIIYYESSRGCPFSCSYCLSSIEKGLRFRNISLVKKELQYFIDRKVPQVKFIDRTFNCNHEHAMAIWEYITEHDNGITNFHFEISADLLTDEEINLMSRMRPGLIQLEIGVQSTNPETIEKIHRTMNLDRLKKAVGNIQKFGNIHMHLDLIAGLPDEDLDSFSQSFDEVYSLKPDQLQLGFLKVLKGSFMYEHADEYGVMYHSLAPYEVMQTKWLRFDDILKLKRIEEMVEVYYNSGQFVETVKLLEVMHDRPFSLYMNLGEFYGSKGYYDMSHSRLRRAEILLEYVNEWVGKYDSDGVMLTNSHNDIFTLVSQALTFDLYGRENCKTRPSWAPDASSFKRETRKYCPDGKVTHIEPFDYVFAGESVRTIDALPQKCHNKVWYLFDYRDRNPLNNQATIKLISLT